MTSSLSNNGGPPIRTVRRYRYNAYVVAGLVVIILLPVSAAAIGGLDHTALISNTIATMAIVLLAALVVGVFYILHLGTEADTAGPAASIKSPSRTRRITTTDAPSRTEVSPIEDQLERIRSRLQNEIDELRSRGFFNMVVGLVAAGLTMGLLVWFIIELTAVSRALQNALEHGERLPVGFVPDPRDWKDVISLQATRLSMVLLAGGVCFFFLRLYSSSLDSIKYYQNELTNVENRFAALAVAVGLSDSAATVAVLNQLSQTERNFVLKRGETTVELELRQQEVSFAREMAQLLHSTLGTKSRTRVRNQHARREGPKPQAG